MYLPPLQPTCNSHYYMNGNVIIHPSAAISPGVVLQADPESQIIISAGVCIGMGAVLHAHQGTIAVREGANIGAGVLIVGKGEIGTNACIGSSTTILNSSIGQGEVIAPASLIGDTSRSATNPETSEAETFPASEVASQNEEAMVPPLPENDPAPVSELPTEQQIPESTGRSGLPVYGQNNLNRLLATLLPHRQSLNRPLQDDSDSPSQQ